MTIIRTMKRCTYFLTEQQIRRLEQESKRTGLSVSELVRRAIDEYLDKRKEKGK